MLTRPIVDSQPSRPFRLNDNPSDDYDKIDYDGTIGILQFLEAVADDIIQADTRPTFQEAPQRSGSRGSGLKVRMGFRPEGFGERDTAGVGVLEVVEGQPAQAG